MIERTQKRLRAARFFYQRLVDSKNPLRNEPEAFEFYLSAFIQLARTVPWVLKKEETAKYEAWNPRWEERLSPEERKLLNFTTACRNADVKEGGIETRIDECETIDIYELLKNPPHYSSDIFDVHRQHPAYHDTHRPAAFGTESPSLNLERSVSYFDRGDVKEEVTVTCQKYLDYLEKFVREFEQDHKTRSDSSDQ
jgi:hypothetical protein